MTDKYVRLEDVLAQADGDTIRISDLEAMATYGVLLGPEGAGGVDVLPGSALEDGDRIILRPEGPLRIENVFRPDAMPGMTPAPLKYGQMFPVEPDRVYVILRRARTGP